MVPLIFLPEKQTIRQNKSKKNAKEMNNMIGA
jgi:hypothetical protein